MAIFKRAIGESSPMKSGDHSYHETRIAAALRDCLLGGKRHTPALASRAVSGLGQWTHRALGDLVFRH